jgi:hypothetical protein
VSNIEIEYINQPFKINELPLTKVYVLDNWLSSELHHYFDGWITRSKLWSKTNQVNANHSTGLPHHSLWGASFYRNGFKIDSETNQSDLYFINYLMDRLQVEFGFKWVDFQYAGLNSQTMGQHGTTHNDCPPECDYNLSFLYYTNKYWNPTWGGDLRLYDAPQQGLDGRQEHIDNHCIGSIEFKPNRLLMFDGRIPHGADAPADKARYADRKSLVIRADEVKLVKDYKELDYANDRFRNLQRRNISRL